MSRFWAGLALVGLALGAAEAQTGLVATAGAGQLTLTWQDNSDAETAFVIERSLPNDVCEFVEVAWVAMDVETFVDPELAPGVRWCYRVHAANETGASAPSNVACGTVPDPTPPPTSAFGDFVKDAAHMGPFSVAIGGYTCTRVVGGTAQARIYQGSALLKTVSLANPPLGVQFRITCEVTPTTVVFKVDNAIKLTANR